MIRIVLTWNQSALDVKTLSSLLNDVSKGETLPAFLVRLGDVKFEEKGKRALACKYLIIIFVNICRYISVENQLSIFKVT